MKTHRKHRHRWAFFHSAPLVEAHICQACDFAYDQLLFDPALWTVAA